jgi:hypothetical protein
MSHRKTDLGIPCGLESAKVVLEVVAMSIREALITVIAIVMMVPAALAENDQAPLSLYG